jgi:hypothetical protein
MQEPGALGPRLRGGRAVGEDQLAPRVEALGEPEQAESERLDVRDVDRLREPAATARRRCVFPAPIGPTRSVWRPRATFATRRARSGSLPITDSSAATGPRVRHPSGAGTGAPRR